MSDLLKKRCTWTPYLKYGVRRYYKRNSVIYREKEESLTGLYYLKTGLIKITSIIHTGEKQIIDIVCEETPFGEQVVDGKQYFSTATAINESVIYFFPIAHIETLLREDESFRILFYHSLTNKLRILSNNLLFDSLPAEKLLARKILTLREKFMSDRFPFTQLELCRFTNLNRITVYHIFQKWKGHVASLDKRTITIHSLNTLKEIADF